MEEDASFRVFFERVPDPRALRTKRHKLTDVLPLVLMATIVGQRGWDGMAEWAKDSEEYLVPLLELPNGMPSADTLRRVIGALDPVALRDAFIAWAEALNGSPLGKHAAIDGKTVRGSFASNEGEGALHLGSAWACENRAVLGQVATDVKSNEITAIPELIALLNLRGAVVTTDAQIDVAELSATHRKGDRGKGCRLRVGAQRQSTQLA